MDFDGDRRSGEAIERTGMDGGKAHRRTVGVPGAERPGPTCRPPACSFHAPHCGGALPPIGVRQIGALRPGLTAAGPDSCKRRPGRLARKLQFPGRPSFSNT